MSTFFLSKKVIAAFLRSKKKKFQAFLTEQLVSEKNLKTMKFHGTLIRTNLKKILKNLPQRR